MFGEQELINTLRKVATLRNKVKDLKNTLDAAKKAFEHDNQDTTDALNSKKLELSVTEDTARAQAIALFEETGEKSLTAGVQIRERTILEYSDRDAEKWCDTNMPIAFERKFNRKTFEDYAKVHPLDFVTLKKAPEAALPRTLELPPITTKTEDGGDEEWL